MNSGEATVAAETVRQASSRNFIVSMLLYLARSLP